MRKKILLTCTICLFCMAILYLYFQNQSEELIKHQGNFSVIAKSTEDGIEYFVKPDGHKIYDYLSSLKLEKAETYVLEHWIYKVFLTNTLNFDEDGKPIVRDDGNTSVICVYGEFLEVDGALYKIPRQVVEWFDYFYSDNMSDYERYAIP